MSSNPFAADPDVSKRLARLEHERGDDVRQAIGEALSRNSRDPIENIGGVLLGADAAAIARANGITPDELMLLALATAQDFARPPISDFHVGAVGREAGSDNLVFGGNLEFVGAHIGNTVHGEGFVFARAFSRGTTIETLAIGEAHPCAHCRQFLSEFAASAKLTLIDPLGHRLTLAQLYPWPFDPAYLGETGAVPGLVGWPDLTLPGDATPPGAAALLTGAVERAHAPYSKCPAAVALWLEDGRHVTGATIESVAFNPGLGPLQAALIDLYAHGYATADIEAAALGVLSGGAVDYVAGTAALLAAVAPGVPLTVHRWR